MTYTINQAVDVNAAVDIGNIQLNENTISSTDTNGHIVLSPNGSGNVGIGTSSPAQLLTISDSEAPFLRFDRSNTSRYDYEIGMSASNLIFRGGTDGSGNSLTEFMRLSDVGRLGVGTTDPKAKLHVSGGGDSGTSLASASRSWINSSNSIVNHNTSAVSFGSMSIYASGEVVSSSVILSHGTSSYSDARIKSNIVDIEDDSALQTIRLLKPKKYSYIDTISKGTTPVWGFIAQEVSDVLDYSVEKMEKAIPNIYCTATVIGEEYDILEFSNFDTGNLQYNEDNTLMTKIQCKLWNDGEMDINIAEVLSSSKIRVTQPLEKSNCNDKEDQSGDVVNTIFVYGQYVDDFHVLKKDAIFTVTVAALQEVDRRQTMDNERILELEGDLTEAQETIATQAQDIATLQAQVAALMQHTGVTI